MYDVSDNLMLAALLTLLLDVGSLVYLELLHSANVVDSFSNECCDVSKTRNLPKTVHARFVDDGQVAPSFISQE